MPLDMDDQPPWKRLRLSLERPYTDDDGQPIPVLLDIAPDGQHIYEPKEDPTALIGENLRRIFLERGIDFFDRKNYDRGKPAEPNTQPEDEADAKEESHGPPQPMTPEELFRMRMEIMPQLHIALGEMSQARDLLALLLATNSPAQTIQGILGQAAAGPSQPTPATTLPLSTLTATVVTKPPPILSVQAFNTQLVIGGKDRALRKAADLFKSAAESMESGCVRSEKYWVNALKIRRGNWGLVPAPLPLGSATGKGADKTSKDFEVSFGLEESPPIFRLRAMGRIPTLESDENALEFPRRQHTRLQVSIITTDSDGSRRTARNTITTVDGSTLDASLRAAQAEVVEQEIFATLIKEASTLPTASARVSERLIVIEAAQAVELRFELIDSDLINHGSSCGGSQAANCDLIASVLHILLLRAHSATKAERLKRSGTARPLGAPPAPFQPPPLLQPVIDLLQYQVFCARIRAEMDRVVNALRDAGVPVDLRFEPTGGIGEELLAQLRESRPKPIGGEALIRIDNRYTLRFTFISPSILIAHLPQSTILIPSIPQLVQQLEDQVEGCLSKRTCEIGNEQCSSIDGTWFIDELTGKSVGRWEGCALNFKVSFAEESLVCVATRLDRPTRHIATTIDTYRSHERNGSSLMGWIRIVIQAALMR